MSSFERRPRLEDLAPPGLDPSYPVFSGGVWTYAPPPAGGILNNFAAVTNPTAGDDSGDGYVVGSQWINTATDQPYICTDNTLGAAVWKPMAIPSGSVANVEAIYADFAYNTASPVDIGPLFAGDIVNSVEIRIDVPFDDPAATLTVGNTGSPTAYMVASANDPDVEGTYFSEDSVDVAAPTTARLTISPGAATAGTGRVLVLVIRA